ncbi:MAG: hypothetical protein KAW46_01655, partial [candidate division Zixibacteria bacterium]|nr:hypothetical protein [candidate division Zixibacteria bacterium]
LLSAKYAVSSSVTIEAALNPDFSQIEADAAQIDVNTTIALLFPERRPFFQEGSDIFRTLFNSFYTRTVYDPQLVVKLTGRMDKTSIGFLTAIDENSPYMIPLDEASIVVNTGRSVVNVLRATLRRQTRRAKPTGCRGIRSTTAARRLSLTGNRFMGARSSPDSSAMPGTGISPLITTRSIRPIERRPDMTRGSTIATLR